LWCTKDCGAPICRNRHSGAETVAIGFISGDDFGTLQRRQIDGRSTCALNHARETQNTEHDHNPEKFLAVE
jgi:hypothetical protein